MEADIAAIEWVRLASAQGALQLTEDVVALGGELQLARLKECRDCKDITAARACYVEPSSRDSLAKGDYTGVDREIAAQQAVAQQETGGAMAEMD